MTDVGAIALDAMTWPTDDVQTLYDRLGEILAYRRTGSSPGEIASGVAAAELGARAALDAKFPEDT